MFGYHRKLLRADLTNRRIEVEDLDEAMIRKYVGGVGIEANILYRKIEVKLCSWKKRVPLFMKIMVG